MILKQFLTGFGFGYIVMLIFISGLTTIWVMKNPHACKPIHKFNYVFPSQVAGCWLAGEIK